MSADLEQDARRFIAAIDSQYFHDVCTALGTELQVTDPDQAIALDKLYTRLLAMRDLLEKRLIDLQRREAHHGGDGDIGRDTSV